MNSLTTHYRRSQLIALPVPGGKAKVEYCYAVNVPGDREIVTHSFAEWAVGDFNRQKETVLCDKLTAGSKITTECPSESFVGNRKHNGLSTSAKAMSMNASVRSNSFVVNSGKERSVMSTKLTGYVWDGCAASGMKLSSVAIMARLADFSNDEGVCWPSIETIARQIGAGMSTVRTAIARLEAEGWLTRKARRQGNRNASNVYQLNVAKLQAAAFSQLSDSDPSKSDASKSAPSKFDASKSGKKAGFHPSESGGDPSVKSKHDPSDKKTSRPDASQPDTQTAEQEFLTRHPDAVVFSPKKRQWGTQDDLTCAQWLWKKIIALYEQAAECDGEVVRPKEPNWTAWANEIRLMCVQDGRTHKQICEMYSRVSRDPFWCRNVLSPSKLREKWDELSLRLSPSVSTYTEKREDPYFKASYDNVDYSQIPAGFRG